MTLFRRIAEIASTRGIAGTVSLALLLGSVGCKSKDSGPSSNLSRNDPLLAGPGRIPRQNIPLPDRGTAGGKRPDPLLGSPTSGTRSNTGGFSVDPDRFKNGPYLPGPGGSPAALAGNPLPSDEGLSIDLPGGVGLTPAGGPIAAPDRPAPRAPAAPLGSDAAFAELAKYGVQRGDYVVAREDGVVLVRVKVLTTPEGPSQSFTGQGPTESAAVKQVVEQLKAAKVSG
jgi:hypothetical protein